MRIAIGADHHGFAMRVKLNELLRRLTIKSKTSGHIKTVDYPDVAAAVARKVSQGEVDRGALMSARTGSACASPPTRFRCAFMLPATTISRLKSVDATTTSMFLPSRGFPGRVADRSGRGDMAQDAF